MCIVKLSITGRTGRVGNLGKATSFIDPEGDGDVMPKLVDMLTKVAQLHNDDFIHDTSCFFSSIIFIILVRLVLKCLSSSAKVKAGLEETLGGMMTKTGVNKAKLLILNCPMF